MADRTESTTRAPVSNPVGLLRYRPWRGEFQGPLSASWAIARVSLGQIFRRRLFWALYAWSLLIFAFYFFGQYLQVFIETQLTEDSVRLGSGVTAMTVKPGDLMKRLSDVLKLNGSADTFGNFIWTEGYIVMIILAMAGSVLVGNDFHHGSLPFYLSKPISRWHYILGKGMAVSVFVHLMTTIPAIGLFVQYSLIVPDTWGYIVDNFRLLLGILGYGLILSTSLSLLLVTTATWLRQTVPMIMIWTTLFVFTRELARWLVDIQRYPEEWRLIDLWNNLYLLGQWCLGVSLTAIRPQPQPAYWQPALVMASVAGLCLLYLHRRIQAVEVVR
ncbi:ABC transporter permease [Tuwongella immobilis]|uniref:: ABC2_membrane_4 n=1 Tax=Tuwongella immobilis TaxID=692036 RepID=A0A6C2YSW8_9BACT|nr:ABC transporter permease subunit [Tuwongella immobilis]VIP04149.1 : ABC2_membrane_4 [Tuwongella immobilis]VTS05663.1 : ABC2_membrane_4 [Tuwongella immobilis]